MSIIDIINKQYQPIYINASEAASVCRYCSGETTIEKNVVVSGPLGPEEKTISVACPRCCGTGKNGYRTKGN
jgi:hypothetical protein